MVNFSFSIFFQRFFHHCLCGPKFPADIFSGLDSTAVGDEGGFAPAVADPEEAALSGSWGVEEIWISNDIMIWYDYHDNDCYGIMIKSFVMEYKLL